MSDPYSLIRLLSFAGIFCAVALTERRNPFRSERILFKERWLANVGITVFNTWLVRLIFPGTAVSLGFYLERTGTGLLNLLHLPLWARILAALVILDFVIYLQHRLMHRIPVLWRLHRMHHSDPDFDVTTGSRFHPAEILLSTGLKYAIIYTAGTPGYGVLVFEILLNGMAMFTHGNIRLAEQSERILRTVVITPDLHRVHHSVIPSEHHKNFGFCLSCWDHLFGTLKVISRPGLKQTDSGLSYLPPDQSVRFPDLIRQPFFTP